MAARIPAGINHKKRGSAAVFPAADAAAQKRAAINIDDEGNQNKKQKLSDSVVITTTDIFTRYSRVENHYYVALCSISKSLLLLTKLNVDIDDEGHQIQKRVAASKKKAAPKKRAAKAVPKKKQTTHKGACVGSSTSVVLVGQTKIDEIWKIVRVIPTAEEQIPCRFKECSKKDAAMFWASDKDLDDLWNLCKGCQVIEFGGWPAGVVPIKYLGGVRDDNTAATVSALVDLINMDDFFKMRLASFLDEMSAEEYRLFCLKLVEGCDTITTSDYKLSYGFSKYDDDHCTFLKKVQKKSTAFMEVVRNHYKPLHDAILTILEPHLLCVFPLVLRGELRMHADKPTAYGIPGKVERWCIYFFDKIMKLQQKENRDNYVVINCSDGDAVCMNDKGRGIDQFPGGVTVDHGCPKGLMKGVGSELSITIVVDDVSFEDEVEKLKVLKQPFSRFASAVPSDSNSNSIQSLSEVIASTAVATRPSFLLHNIDPKGSAKNAIDAKAALLLTTCVTFNCNEKSIKGTRHCKVCSNRNRECCVEECWSLNRDCLYCKRHSDQKTRCLKCLIRGRPDGSSLCSTCNLLCRTNNCKNQLAKGSGTKLYVFNLFESQEMSCCRLQGSTL